MLLGRPWAKHPDPAQQSSTTRRPLPATSAAQGHNPWAGSGLGVGPAAESKEVDGQVPRVGVRPNMTPA